MFTGKHLRLIKVGHWEYVERPNASGIVVIVAVTAEDKLIFTEQFRPPLGKRVIELPAGLAGDVPGAEKEDLSTAARRELLEETGYEARDLVFLAGGPPSAGLTSEVVNFFQAIDLHRVNAGGGDGTENIQVHEVPCMHVDAWLSQKVQAGLLVDPKVYAGLYLLLRSRKPLLR